MPKGGNAPSGHGQCVPVKAILDGLVKLWVLSNQLFFHILLETGRRDRHQSCKDHVPQRQKVFVIERPSRPGVQEAKPKLDRYQTDGLVKRKEDDLAHSQVRVPSMDREESLQVLELLETKVGGPSGLSTLHSLDTDTDMGSLDHGDVVGSITNRQGDLVQFFADQFDNQSLLKRGNTTADDLE